MYKIIIHLILLIDMSFLYLIPIESLSIGTIGYYQKTGLVMISISIIIIYSKKIFNNEVKYLFKNNILLLCFMVFISINLSKLTYNQSFLSILSVSSQYIVLITYFLINYALSKNISLKDFEVIVMKYTIILSILFIIQYIVYSVSGNLFLNIKLGTRYDSIRIYESDYFLVFGSILSYSNIFKLSNNSREKNISVIAFILSFIEVVFISKSRMGLIMILISCFIVSLIRYRTNLVKQTMIIFICLISALILINIPIIKKAFLSISANDTSLIIRERAFEFYGEQFKEKPLLGVGFIKPIENDYSYYLARGYNGMFYKEDMGILGSIHTLGIVFGVWYIFLCLKILKVIYILYKYKLEREFIEIFGICILVILGSIVMNPFDPQRVVVLIIFIALVEASYRYSRYIIGTRRK